MYALLINKKLRAEAKSVAFPKGFRGFGLFQCTNEIIIFFSKIKLRNRFLIHRSPSQRKTASEIQTYCNLGSAQSPNC